MVILDLRFERGDGRWGVGSGEWEVGNVDDELRLGEDVLVGRQRPDTKGDVFVMSPLSMLRLHKSFSSRPFDLLLLF